MNCSEFRNLLAAYADNELDALPSQQMQQHAAGCIPCQRLLDAELAVKSAMAVPALYQPASSDFLQHMFEALGATQRIDQNRKSQWLRAALAAVILLVVGIAIGITTTSSRPSAIEFDVAEALTAHVRSLQAGSHLLDVVSTDQHTVKPWFNGRLDFSPSVRDFSEYGFPLAGGRLDVIHERSVAALIYHRQKHIINLFIWPGASSQIQADQQGFHLQHWSQDDMTYCAVSDVNPQELDRFVQLIRSQPLATTNP